MKTVRRIKKNCCVCGKVFDAYNYRNIYCPDCRKYNKGIIPKTVIGETIKCKGCGKELIRTTGNKIWCSDKCRRMYDIKNRSEDGLSPVRIKEPEMRKIKHSTKFDKEKCKRCKYRSGSQGGMIVCNYGAVTDRSCLRLDELLNKYDIRGDEYNKCRQYIKGERVKGIGEDDES